MFWNSNTEFCLCCVFIVGVIRLKIRSRTWNASGGSTIVMAKLFPKHLVSLGGSRQVNTEQFDYTQIYLNVKLACLGQEEVNIFKLLYYWKKKPA